MSDDPVRSIVETDEGALDFQDYFVRRQCKPVFRGVRFQGAESAEPSAGLRDALGRAQAIVITPSNPFVSIDPILALPGIKDALRQSQRPVVAVSPIVGGKAVKGPLGKMMSELGVEPSALGVARHYGRLVDGWVIDDVDRGFGACDRSARLPGQGLQYHHAHARRKGQAGAGCGGTGLRNGQGNCGIA